MLKGYKHLTKIDNPYIIFLPKVKWDDGVRLLHTEFIYEDQFIVISKALYEKEDGARITQIDVGYKDEDDDIVCYRTVAEFQS